MNHYALNKTIEKICRFAVQLPRGIGVLTYPSGLPLAPIMALDGETISYWVIYLQRYGSGDCPTLSGAQFDSNGVAHLERGRLLGRLRINDSQIQFGNTVVELLNKLAAELQKRTPAEEN